MGLDHQVFVKLAVYIFYENTLYSDLPFKLEWMRDRQNVFYSIL